MNALTIYESLVVDSHGKDAADEAEVFQMMLIAKARLRIDLKRVVITE